MKTCCVQDCDRAAEAKGMCFKHYMRVRRTGSPASVGRLVGVTPAERFWTYVRKTEGCWMWTGGVSHTYGNFHVKRPDGTNSQIAAHRFAYELLVGPIPEGMTLDHMCHTPKCKAGKDCPHRRCVNPDHLEPATLSENIKRGGNGTKTHCKRGHAFTPENTIVFTNATGNPGRKCRACVVVLARERPARERAARERS